jgi:hypothetical protein
MPEIKKGLLAVYVFPKNTLTEAEKDAIKDILSWTPYHVGELRGLTVSWSDFIKAYKSHVKKEIEKFEEIPEVQSKLGKAWSEHGLHSILTFIDDVEINVLSFSDEIHNILHKLYIDYDEYKYEHKANFIRKFTSVEDPSFTPHTKPSRNDSLGKFFLLALSLLGAYTLLKD